MKLGFGKVTVNPEKPAVKFAPGPFARYQKVKDELSYKIMILKESEKPYIHISCPIADFELPTTQALKKQMQEKLGYEFELTIAITHTHYSVNVNKDPEYVSFLADRLAETIGTIELKEYDDLKTCFQYHYFDKVGQSRISGQPTKNLFLETLSIYSGASRLATLIVYNSHPTTLSMKVEYFSSVGPGILMKTLEENHPGEFFSYMIGAAGDVSTRFTRPGQTYEDMLKMTETVVEEVESQLASQKNFQPLNSYQVEECWLKMKREFFDISTVEIPENLTPREKETIDQAMKNKNKVTQGIKLEDLPEKLMFQRLRLGAHQFIFTPFELFSEYIDYTNKENTSLVNCGNDRDGYLSGLGKQRLTFELFGQTIALSSKLDIKALLEKWSPKEK